MLCFGLPSRALHEWLCVLVVCCTGKFDIKVSAPKLGIELLVFSGKRWRFALLFFAPFVLGGVVALGAFGWDGTLQPFFPERSPTSERWEYAITQIAVVPRYLHLFFMPNDLCVEQTFPILWDSARGDFPAAVPDADPGRRPSGRLRESVRKRVNVLRRRCCRLTKYSRSALAK